MRIFNPGEPESVPTTNPFIEIAHRSMEYNLDLQQTEGLIGDLLPDAGHWELACEALGHAYSLNLNRDFIFVDRIASVCLLAPEIAGNKMHRAEIHLRTGIEFQEQYNKNCLTFALRHLDCVCRLLERHHEWFIKSEVKSAVVHYKLSEIGVDPLENVEAAIRLASVVTNKSISDSPIMAEALMVQGASYAQRMIFGVDLEDNQGKALKCLKEARKMFDRVEAASPNCAVVRVQEAIARGLSARLGFSPARNSRASVRLFHSARMRFGDQHIDAAGQMSNEAGARIQLAQLGVDTVANAEKAIELCRETRSRLDERLPNYDMQQGRAFANEATAMFVLAEIGKEPKENAEEAIRLFRSSRQWLEARSPDFGASLVSEAKTNILLSNFEVEAKPYLESAIDTSRKAKQHLFPGSVDHVEAISTELEALRLLARSQPLTEWKSTLEQCLDTLNVDHVDAWENPISGIHILLAQARVHLDLAHPFVNAAYKGSIEDRRRDQISQLDKACSFARAASSLSQEMPVLPENALLIEGNASLGLAQLDHQIDANIGSAIAAFEAAISKSIKGSNEWYQAMVGKLECCLFRNDLEIANDLIPPLLTYTEKKRSLSVSTKNRDLQFETMAKFFELAIDVKVQLANSITGEQRIEVLKSALEVCWKIKGRSLTEQLTVFGGSEYKKLKERQRQLVVRRSKLQKQITDSPEPSIASRFMEELLRVDEDLTVIEEQLENHLHQQIAQNDKLEPISSSQSISFKKSISHLNRLIGQSDDAMPSRVALLEFFVSGMKDVFVFLIPLWDSENLNVFTIRREIVDLVPDISRINPEVVENDQPAISAAAMDYSLDSLKFLVEPLADDLAELNPDQLVLSPHGILSRVPLHALPSKGKPLVESYCVTYLAPVTVADFLISAEASSNVCLIGNPTSDLLESSAELNQLSTQFASQDWTVCRLEKANASAANLSKASRQSSIVHISSHVAIHARNFEESAIALADGKFHPKDILKNLNLGNSLVVLNACSSATGTIARSDEFQSFIRLLYATGASAVVGTLWRIDDSVAADFAELFYAKLLQTDDMSLRDAFSLAIKELKEVHPNPYFWSTFVLHGHVWQSFNSVQDA